MLINASGGGGSGVDLTKSYNFNQQAEFETFADIPQAIVPATSRPNPRRIIIHNSTNSLIWLSFASPDAPIYPLEPGNAYFSDDAGGEAGGIWAIGPGTLRATILSRDPLILPEQDMPPIPLKVRTRIPTGQNKILYFALDAVYPAIFESNFAKLFDADSGVAGFKAFELTSFQPLTEYIFNVAIAPGLALNPPIQIFIPQWDRLMAAALELHAFKPEESELPGNFIGNVIFSGWVGNTDINNQFKFRPEWGRHIGGICARNPAKSNYSDFLSFTYEASTQTFTLLGF
ncbi:hypothetical protein [Laspinema palackyanum]|uniref:hypothetical protein n=1 Tax=Laspinema palackyanum TaxID=3231601 RepID=UPI00345DCB00|nr:hypothetical protein [Laspinema sp. D2c]